MIVIRLRIQDQRGLIIALAVNLEKNTPDLKKSRVFLFLDILVRIGYMKWINYVHITFGVWIFLSPWILGFSDIAPALWSNCLFGIAVTMVSLYDLVDK